MLLTIICSKVLQQMQACRMSHNTRTLLTAKLLQQGYGYHELRKTFSKFYRRHYELIFKFNVGLKTLLRKGLLEPEFYGDLVYKKKLIGGDDFSFLSSNTAYALVSIFGRRNQKNHYTLQTYRI